MRILNRLIITGFVLVTTFYLSSCVQQNNPLANSDNSELLSESLNKPTIEYPQYAERTIKCIGGNYQSGNVNVPGGSTFSIATGSLIPPPEITWGDPVVVSMLVEFDELNNELTFTFGPHGTSFTQSAEVWFDFSVLASNNVNLYYLNDDGSRELQQPVEMQGQRIKVYIDHFSRYAIGTE